MSLDEVIETLMNEAPRMHKPVLVGMGNEINGDDGVGNYVAQRLVSEVKNIMVLDVGTQPDNFTMKIIREKPTHVIFVDAATIEGPGGSISRIPLEDIDNFFFHTHYVSLKLIIHRILDRCDCRALVIGVKPVSMEQGDPLTEPVKDAAGKIIAMFIELDKAIEDYG